MDWLRIAAFGVLIAYHIGMVFAPWLWIIKARETWAWLIPPMAFVTPWRLGLLFAVSGYASRTLFARSGGVRAFLASRNARLLVPLAVAMAAIVPVEMWVRVRLGGYEGDYLTFWTRDYWRVGAFHGVSFPSWEHLWFVAYLWTYTLALGAVLASGMRADAVVAWLCRGRRLLWVPAAAIAMAKLVFMVIVPERHALLTDWGGHSEYGALFAFGFVLAGSPRLWAAVRRLMLPALALAVPAGLVVVWVEWTWPGAEIPPHAEMAADRAARAAMAWSMTVALFAAADRWLNRDHRWRAPLARAVFPAYILHHGTIVLTAWWILPLAPSPVIAAAVIAAATLGVCVAGYALGSRVRWIGAAIGMPHRAPPPERAVGRAAALR